VQQKILVGWYENGAIGRATYRKQDPIRVLLRPRLDFHSGNHCSSSSIHKTNVKKASFRRKAKIAFRFWTLGERVTSGGPPTRLVLKIEYPCIPSQIQVFPNHLFKKHASMHRPVQHLGQGKLGLQNGDCVSVSGFAVGRQKRMRQAAQPFSQQGIDLLCRQLLADRRDE
jgi:hypothetical protein